MAGRHPDIETMAAGNPGQYVMDPAQSATPSAQLQEQLSHALATIAILGALTFNLFLCFVNTRIMPVSESHVMMCEILLIGCAFLVAFDRRLDIYLILALFVSYMLLLFALRGVADIKSLRDVFIPVAFYFAGAKIQNVRLADRLVALSVSIVLVIALFEYFLLETYLDFFNVLGYYMARGTVSPEDTFGQTRGLFISGIRPEPRSLLPFLGQHRVSSVFLEPVSAGNFGAIIYAWALFRGGMRFRLPVMAAALAFTVLADARFGFFTCIVMTLGLPFYRFVPKVVWLVLPFLMLAVIAAYGLTIGAEGGPNDVAGRLKVTAAILIDLDLSVVLGSTATSIFTADSGFAYTLTSFGIFGFIGLWAALIFAPLKDAKAWSFHSMIVIYLLLLMLISNSFFSIKTAALMWFILGTADRVDWTRVQAVEKLEKAASRLRRTTASA